jgi:hypothetical protein
MTQKTQKHAKYAKGKRSQLFRGYVTSFSVVMSLVVPLQAATISFALILFASFASSFWFALL